MSTPHTLDADAATPTIDSAAFRRTTLESEKRRVIATIAALIALVAVSTTRSLLGGSEQLTVLPRILFLTAAYLVYEWRVLGRIRAALRAGSELPRSFFALNLVLEALLPTLVILVLLGSDFFGPQRALTAPALSLYFLFIILSVMRLEPRLAVLTGLVSALGYTAVAGIATSVVRESAAMPFGVYLTYAVSFLIAGLIAAGVASELRKHVAAALREAEARAQIARMEHDLDLARSIQQGLLPKAAPELAGFDVAGWNQPADQTGGDYYDWGILPDGRLALSLADVTGHGIGAALVTAVCCAYGRASFTGEAPLTEFMTRINKLLSADLPRGKLVTYVAALVDPKTSRIDMLSAGHGPLLHYHAADQTFSRFDAQGVPLGVSALIPYKTSQELTLDPGDMLVLMTDGFFEWVDAADEEFDMDRVEASIRASAAKPASEIIADLYRAVLDFAAGTAQLDDLTAVIIKRLPA